MKRDPFQHIIDDALLKYPERVACWCEPRPLPGKCSTHDGVKSSIFDITEVDYTEMEYFTQQMKVDIALCRKELDELKDHLSRLLGGKAR